MKKTKITQQLAGFLQHHKTKFLDRILSFIYGVLEMNKDLKKMMPNPNKITKKSILFNLCIIMFKFLEPNLKHLVKNMEKSLKMVDFDFIRSNIFFHGIDLIDLQ